MSVRLVLAVIVALALLASAIPLVEQAQRARGEQQVESSVDTVRETASRLARRNDPVPSGVPGARTRVRIDLPENAGPVVLRIGAGFGRPGSNKDDTNDTDLLSYRVDGGERRTVPVDVDIRARHGPEMRSDSDALVIREDTTITMGYRLVEGAPVVTVVRGFKSGNRTSESHARLPSQ